MTLYNSKFTLPLTIAAALVLSACGAQNQTSMTPASDNASFLQSSRATADEAINRVITNSANPESRDNTNSSTPVSAMMQCPDVADLMQVDQNILMETVTVIRSLLLEIDQIDTSSDPEFVAENKVRLMTELSDFLKCIEDATLAMPSFSETDSLYPSGIDGNSRLESNEDKAP